MKPKSPLDGFGSPLRKPRKRHGTEAPDQKDHDSQTAKPEDDGQSTEGKE